MSKSYLKNLEMLIESMVQEALKEDSDPLADDLLIKAFITPFTDIIKTAKGELEKTVAVGTANIKNLAKQAAVAMIPTMALSIIDDIQENSEQELRERLSKINDRYADVLKRNWDTVRKRDVWGLTFMLDPTFGIAEKFLARAPFAALGTLEILSGGHPKVTNLKNQAKKLVTHKLPQYADSIGDSFWSGDFGLGESVNRNLFEQQKMTPEQQQEFENIKAQIAAEVKKLKSDKGVINAMRSSPVAKQLHAGAAEAIIDTAKPVLAAGTYEQIKNALGPKIEKFEQELLAKIPKEEQTPEKIKELHAEMVPVIKKAYKDIIANKLMEMQKTHPNISKSIDKLIQKINSF